MAQEAEAQTCEVEEELSLGSEGPDFRGLGLSVSTTLLGEHSFTNNLFAHVQGNDRGPKQPSSFRVAENVRDMADLDRGHGRQQ